MPRMLPLQELENLYFSAQKLFIDPPAKYYVEGYPNSVKEYYREHERDFFFRTYKEVIVAGILWTQKLFNSISIDELNIKHLEFGRRKQWFNVQLVHTGGGVIIDNEKFNPYINISYSYNTVTKIKFEIGFYRSACSNGLVSGFKELAKLEVKPENLFDIPFWINPCLIEFLTKRLEFHIRILKRTYIKGEQIHSWIKTNVSKWNISDQMVYQNIKDLGENAYCLLNILTYSASNFEVESFNTTNLYVDNNFEDQSANSERASRQRKVGIFLEYMIEQIIKENHIDYTLIDINSPEFRINDYDLNLLSSLKIKEVYKFEFGKIKF